MDPSLLTRIALAFAAIAHAEGFWVPNARPRRNNNPGDILDHAGMNIVYGDIFDGAGSLALQLELMLSGRSHVYQLTMTWRQVAELWTGGDNATAWCASVCDDLGVSEDSTLGEYAGVSPSQPAAAPDPEPWPAPAPLADPPAQQTS